MRPDERRSIKWLEAVLVASVLFPVLVFCLSAWQTYQDVQGVADDQINRSRDVLHEHALKVFEAVERSIAEVNEIIRDMSDAEISANEEKLHVRLKRMVGSSAEMKSLWIFDAHGRALANSINFPAPPIDFSDRDYFRAHVDKEVGLYIGQVLRPKEPYGGLPFFSVSKRRVSPAGIFAGVIQVSVLPEYFEGFYEKIGKGSGSYYSLIRADGLVLARLPALDRDMNLPARGLLPTAMRNQPSEGFLQVKSLVDGVERKVSYLRLPNLPVYVVSGRETSAIRAEWLRRESSQLLFAVPATAMLIIVVTLAVRRTKRLYEEEARRRLAEDALRQAQRLEALGRLTGGIAHDFNNLLMVVGGAARKLGRTLHGSSEIRMLQLIEAAVQKGEVLTRKLLAFSRRQSLSSKIIDIAARVRDMRGVLEQSVRADVRLEITTPAAPVAVKVDPEELEMALLNLTLNSRDAMPDGGRIEIEVAEETQGAEPVALITVRDTGHGIPPAIRDRIFEPFFTTKPVDKGSGLGLSQVYGFVQQSNGKIDLASEHGVGTTVRISLPLCKDAVAADPSTTTDRLIFSSPSVLLVEDNADVAVVAADYLDQLKCKVVHASSAEEALKLLAEQGFDLVLSDIVMPGMSGLEMARRIRERHPDIPIILASGYSDKAELAVSDGFSLIRKPYAPQALVRAINQALGERRGLDKKVS
jgi:two-component system NtrC family sensor kinase